ncbi:hypothetical protein [Methylobacter sp.]|uniref:hypothetical protein n=1 Tax=Methylobacter sp. TaxID=2051955 RepID=UPI0011FACAD7|nr:hypothetical protein [Methylobacter sp.]TAK62769.1 MAG: hypothetical protein EPO18_09350 [Methylobacter sp.]
MFTPHAPLAVEETIDGFVRSIGGVKISDELPNPPPFENADYIFREAGVIIELKEVTTDFGKAGGIVDKLIGLHEKHYRNDPSWRPALFGGVGHSKAFIADFVRIFREPLGRILKKANSQIKSTKKNLPFENGFGVTMIVNDGFKSLEPYFVRALISDILLNSNSAIQCCVYITVNTYVEVPESEYAHLLWVPSYSEHAPQRLVDFIDNLGDRWFNHLESLTGPFDVSDKTSDTSFLNDSKTIK